MSTRPWKGRRAQALLRMLWDTTPHVCHLCGQPITKPPGSRLPDGSPDPRRASVDHILPRSRGGSDMSANLRLAHFACNASKGNRIKGQPAVTVDSRAWFGIQAPPPTQPRHVVLLCGPPGAGKTTEAYRLQATQGLEVYDYDSPQWRGRPGTFKAALADLGEDPTARAVVIRSGATRAARAAAAAVIRADEVRVMDTDMETCLARVKARKRPHPPMAQQLAAVARWFDLWES